MKYLCSAGLLGTAARPAPYTPAAVVACGRQPGRRLAGGRLGPRAAAPQDQGSGTIDVAPETLYKRLGGEAHLQGVIDSFYQKAFTDSRLSHWFEGFAPKKMEKNMGRFFKFAFGEEPMYRGRDMPSAHAKLVERGLNDTDYDVLVELFTAAFQESGVSEDMIAEVAAILESMRDPVLCRNLGEETTDKGNAAGIDGETK